MLKAIFCRLFYASVPKKTKSYKPSRITVSINEPEIAARVFRDLWEQDLLLKQEQVYAIYVDEKNKIIKHVHLHTGGPKRCYIDTYLLFEYAFELKASGFFVSHSHKREVLEASTNDIKTTSKIRAIAEELEIRFIDHIIITPKSYFSFSEERLLD